MALEIIILRQRKTNIIWYHLHVESKKNNSINELIYKTGTDSETEQTMVIKEEVGGRDKFEVWD